MKDGKRTIGLRELKGLGTMASKKQREKIDKGLGYVRKQIGLFLWKHYRVKVDIRLYANKELTKKRMYSRTVFPSDRNKPVDVDIEYTLMVTGKKQKLVETAFREATRIGCQRLGRPHMNGHPEFESELRRHGIPSYGGVAEMGLELHSYECSECRKVWALKEKKLPTSKDPEQLGFKTTCCKQPFVYGGVKLYENETLQKIRRSS